MDLIEKYLESKKLAWEESSLKSERARLSANVPGMVNGPAAHFEELSKTKHRNTIKTIFIRLASFEEFAYQTNKYRTFLKTHRNLFKHVYQREKIDISFEEAKKRILAIKDEEVRNKALQLLATGMRWSESFTLDAQNMVTGKGNKRRRIYNSTSAQFIRSYATFWRTLKRETGLKPHTLRKLYVTHLLRNGLPIHEVKDIVGHSSIETTALYAQAPKEEALSDKLRKMVG